MSDINRAMYDKAMSNAAWRGHIEILRLCREWLGFEAIHDELASIAWHPDSWWDWCLTEDEKHMFNG